MVLRQSLSSPRAGCFGKGGIALELRGFIRAALLGWVWLSLVDPVWSAESAHRFFFDIGGLPSGSGLTGELEYHHYRLFGGPVDLHAEGLLSIRGYRRVELRLTAPQLLSSRVFAEFLAQHKNYSQVSFYGLGPSSPEGARTSYREKGSTFLGTLGFRSPRRLRIGARVGWLGTRIGSGANDDFPSIEEGFGPDEIPGLDEQPDLVHGGGFLVVDLRDDPEEPTSGGYYEAQWTLYRDVTLERHDFQDLLFDLRQFFSVGRKTILALRLQSVSTFTRRAQEVPFYLQPTMGGPDTMLGFASDRFSDRNLLVLTAAYRYALSLNLRFGLFADVGQVFPCWRKLRGDSWEVAFGTNAEYKAGRKILLGAGVGFSREGWHVNIRGDFRF
jgi:outer membrane protein assembly factor BamA